MKRFWGLTRLILSCMGIGIIHTLALTGFCKLQCVPVSSIVNVSTAYVCFTMLITLHTGHVQYSTEIAEKLSKISPCIHNQIHISLPASAFQQSPVLYGFTFWMINQTISPDYDAAHIIIAPGSVVIVAFPLLRPLSLWELLCSVNLWNLSSLYQETAGIQFTVYVSTGWRVSKCSGVKTMCLLQLSSVSAGLVCPQPTAPVGAVWCQLFKGN